MTAIRRHFRALMFTLSHSVYLYRSEVRRLRDGLPF